MAGSLAEADKLMKQARKLSSPSMLGLRMRGDWEQATPLFERAGTQYKQAKAYERAREAFEMASTGQERMGSSWHAAKQLEKAAEMAAAASDTASMQSLYLHTAQLFAECGRAPTAAEVLLKCAKAIESADAKGAADMYLQAIEIVENEGKAAMAGDTYRSAISGLLRMSRWADAVGALLRFAMSCDAAGAGNAQCKCYLSAVVVWLHTASAGQAWATYQDAMAVDAFSNSQQAYAAEELFDAYRKADAEAVRACVKSKSTFADLDTQIGRLAKQLPQGSVASQAAELGAAPNAGGVHAADLDEDDLT